MIPVLHVGGKADLTSRDHAKVYGHRCRIVTTEAFCFERQPPKSQSGVGLMVGPAGFEPATSCYHQGVVLQKPATLDELNIVGIKSFPRFGALCWNQCVWLILTVTVTEMLLGLAAWEGDMLGVSWVAGSCSGKGIDWVTPCLVL